jgi:hypothetical protein
MKRSMYLCTSLLQSFDILGYVAYHIFVFVSCIITPCLLANLACILDNWYKSILIDQPGFGN